MEIADISPEGSSADVRYAWPSTAVARKTQRSSTTRDSRHPSEILPLFRERESPALQIEFLSGPPAFRIITCTAPTATSVVALASLSCSPRIARLNARNQSASGHFQPLQINCHRRFPRGSPIIPVSGKPSLEMSRSPSRETFDTAHRCISFCRRLHDKRCARLIHSLQEIRSGRSNISEILQRVGGYSWRENH